MTRPTPNNTRSTSRKLSPVAPGAKVTWLELFYDLVFAYAFINVTLTATNNLDDLVSDLLLVVVLWYLWVTFVTLGNIVRGDEGLMPFATLIGVGATFIAAVVIPDAYGERPHRADYVFAGCYTVVRVVQGLVIWQRVRSDRQVRPRWPSLVGPPLVNSALLWAAAALPHFLPGHIVFIHFALLGLAIAVAYGASVFLGFRELERISTRHWVDRYGQIILIALGEPIIALARAHRLSETLPPTVPVVATAAFGVTIVAAMAIAYFDTRMLAGEHALRLARGQAQVSLARDAYVFLHLPMIIGILLFSLGVRDTLSAVTDGGNTVAANTGLLTASLLYGGTFIYLAALLGFQLRIGQPVILFEIAVRPAVLLMVPAAAVLPPILALAALTLFSVITTVIKYVRGRPLRSQLRAAARAARRALEATEAYEHGREDESPGGPT
jgi:low temperature requirement protein LtrA